MDSLVTPLNVERRLKLERDEIVSKFREQHLSQGTTNGTLKAFLNMFSTDDKKKDLISETYEDGSIYEGSVNVDNVRSGKGSKE